jgi:hypothetical protein
MADSDAVRQQRRRRHRAGDHSMCRRGCQDARPSLKIAEVPAGSGESLDSAAALRDLAAQLQEAYRADPGNALLARELRNTLLVLMPSREAGVDAELRLLMGELSRPVPDGPPPSWNDSVNDHD